MKLSALGSIHARETAEFLDAALNSLYRQTHPADEIVLVHDGFLTSELYNCLDKWQEVLPLKQIPLDKCVGVGKAKNIGLQKCIHDLVAIFDTDDINRANRFAVQVKHFEENLGMVVCSSDVSEFTNTPNDLRRIRKVPQKHHNMAGYAEIRNPMNHPSTMFKKSAVLSVGGYVEDITSMTDYGLFLKLLSKGHKFFNTSDVLVDFRVGNKMLERRRGFEIHQVGSQDL